MQIYKRSKFEDKYEKNDIVRLNMLQSHMMFPNYVYLIFRGWWVLKRNNNNKYKSW